MFWGRRDKYRGRDTLRKRELKGYLYLSSPELNVILTRMLEIALKEADVSDYCYYCCIAAHQGKVRAFSSGCFYSLYLLVMNDLWFGSWIRVSSQSPLWQSKSQ